MNPPSLSQRLYRTLLWAPAFVALLAVLHGAPDPALQNRLKAAEGPIRALLIGGGPNRRNNQAGIESNVRYVSRLLPAGAGQTVLFADGDPKRPTVQYQPQDARIKPTTLSQGERAYALLIEEEQGSLRYRPPKLPRLDGPCRRPSISAAFDRLRAEIGNAPLPLLLYFTGHGSRGEDAEELNTGFDLWGRDGPLSVRQLAAEIKKLPESAPVTLVMVQCFSGGFGNVLFENGDPQGPLVSREIAGFFAATPDRMSAGCTPSLNESEYRDFTSFFFAALSGKDRVGRTVTGVDYNRDGRVGMNEAFAYTLIADDSIDVPVATSDVFLRRFVEANEAEVMQTAYADLKKGATPAQRAALEGLSAKLDLSGEDRLNAAYREWRGGFSRAAPRRAQATWQQFEEIQERHWRTLVGRWPALRNTADPGYPKARVAAVKYLEAQAKSGALKDLFGAEDSLSFGDAPGYSMRDTRLLRFVRLGKSIALAQRLQNQKDPALLKRWKRLQAAEARSFL